MRRPQATFVAVGSELVSGRRDERNGPWLGAQLGALGVELTSRVLVEDDEERIAVAVETALASGCDLVVVSGGLGPTVDDRTRQAVARALGVPLAVEQGLLETLERRYRDRGREMPEGARVMACVPEGAEPVPNPKGSAPGFVLRRRRALFFALPGVPAEFRAMVERSVLPLVRRELAGSSVLLTGALRTAGLPEVEVARRVGEVLPADPRLRAGFYARPGEVEVALAARGDDEADARDLLETAMEKVARVLGDACYGRDEDTLVGVLGRLLVGRGARLGVAESCTGGLVAKRVTDLAGASGFFAGGIVAYANDEKTRFLGVPGTLLDRCGAVSPETAVAMARGARERLGVEVAAATTGIAGPGGGSDTKPVGLVYLAVTDGEVERVTRHVFPGDRGAIRAWATTIVLEQVRRLLLGIEPLGEVSEAGEDRC